MTSSEAIESRTKPLLVASSVCLAVEMWVFSQWLVASGTGTQSESVASFLGHLPLGIGRIGATGVTLVVISFAALGLLLARISKPGERAELRIVRMGLTVFHGVAVLWNLFTLI